MPCSPIVRPRRCRQGRNKHLAYRIPKLSGGYAVGHLDWPAVRPWFQLANTSTCERDRWSAKTLQRPGICRATKLMLKRKHANTKGRSSAMMWGSRDVWLVMTCTRASLSVKKHTFVLAQDLPQMCTAAMIGYNSNTEMFNERPARGHKP